MGGGRAERLVMDSVPDLSSSQRWLLLALAGVWTHLRDEVERALAGEIATYVVLAESPRDQADSTFRAAFFASACLTREGFA
jgi:hypothetical protein